MAGLGLLLTTSFSPVASRPCQHLGIPAYFPPGPEWDAVTLAPAVRYLILNPASGPGGGPHAGYAAAVRAAQERGVVILGYVDTDYGSRPSALIKGDIDRYRHWYGVDGIFLDRTASSSQALAGYRELTRFVRSVPGSIVTMNPGVYPDEGYAKLADMLVTFEGDFDAYRRAIIPSWVERHPPSLFWHLVYSSSEADLPRALELARSRGAETVYVTDRGLDNPWDTPPSYWAREAASVAGTATSCASPNPA